MIAIEPEHALERFHRLRGAPVLEQRAPEGGECLELVGIGLEDPHEHADRRARRFDAAQQVGQREGRRAVRRQQVEGALVGGARGAPVAPLLLQPAQLVPDAHERRVELERRVEGRERRRPVAEPGRDLRLEMEQVGAARRDLLGLAYTIERTERVAHGQSHARARHQHLDVAANPGRERIGQRRGIGR